MGKNKNFKGIMCHYGKLVSTGGIVCSDPCYEENTWCAYTCDSGMEGVWDCYITTIMDKSFGKSITALTIVKEGEEVKMASEKLLYDEIGVDSGTCGFFDKDYYNINHRKGDEENEWYYKNVCDEINYEISGHNTENKGVWSHTAYGDGTYSVYCDYSEDNSTIIRMTVIFDSCGVDVINIVENEEDANFPIECYNRFNLVKKYVKKYGQVEEYFLDHDKNRYIFRENVIRFDKPIRSKFEYYNIKIAGIKYCSDGFMKIIADISFKDNDNFPFDDLMFSQCGKYTQTMIRKRIEEEFKIDVEKEFYNGCE